MFEALKRFLDPAAQEEELPAARQLPVAVAALLYECIRMDMQDLPEQRAAAACALSELFGMEREEANIQMEEGEAMAKRLTSYFRPVSTIKREFSLEKRIQLVEHLWRVAFASGQLDQYEDHYVRKIATLLYVTNTQCMVARSRARSA